jgi:hypothetical protein
MQAQPTGTKDAVVAGFIVWLARNGSQHHLDSDCRQRCTAIIGQLLDWQRHQRDHQQPCGFEAYRALLLEQGRPPFQIAEAERAINLLGHYLRCAPD